MLIYSLQLGRQSNAKMNQNQLFEYYKAILEDDNSLENLIIAFITPQSKNHILESEFNNVKMTNGHHKIWLKWNGEDNNIINLLKNILLKESTGSINPVNEYMRHTLKAFVNYLENIINNSSYKNMRFGQDLGEIIDEEVFTLKDGVEYKIIRRNSTQIQIYKDDEKVVAKPIIRDAIRYYNYDIPLEGLNTRQMGKRFIDKLKKGGAGN